MAWDIISTPAGPDKSLGAGSESKMTCAHGLIHIWEEKQQQQKTGLIPTFKHKTNARVLTAFNYYFKMCDVCIHKCFEAK